MFTGNYTVVVAATRDFSQNGFLHMPVVVL